MGPSSFNIVTHSSQIHTSMYTEKDTDKISPLLGTNSLTSHPPPSLCSVQLSETFVNTRALLWPNVLLIS